ncbi:hypothetical protein BGZ96_001534 [Linnemannia gamsii]|uniref:Uncharacterized protein n=1 Tax=Linnemannia gamsii TaxID=64522 RepID=A0ABQ7K8Y4_9FUNG|nr:hypothetical protein BGZ96_001534 [Linnemannia gamsii]
MRSDVLGMDDRLRPYGRASDFELLQLKAQLIQLYLDLGSNIESQTDFGMFAYLPTIHVNKYLDELALLPKHKPLFLPKPDPVEIYDSDENSYLSGDDFWYYPPPTRVPLSPTPPASPEFPPTKRIMTRRTYPHHVDALSNATSSEDFPRLKMPPLFKSQPRPKNLAHPMSCQRSRRGRRPQALERCRDDLPELIDVEIPNTKDSKTKQRLQHSKCEHEGKTCRHNVTQGFLTSWMVTFVSQYLLGILPSVLTGKALKKPYHEGDRINSFVAGSVAGLAMSLDKNKTRRKALALYLFARSIQFGASYSMKKWAEHREAKKSIQRFTLQDTLQSSEKEHALATKSGWDDILAKVMSSSAGAVLMSSSAAVNFYASILEPDAMPQSYWRFLMHHTGLPQKFGPMLRPLLDVFGSQLSVLKTLPPGVGNITIPAGVASRDFISNISPSVATLFPNHVHHEYQLCALMHPLTPCTGHLTDILTGEFGRALKMYLLNGIIAGLAVLIEAPGRQMELALYCLPRALETTWNLMLKRGVVRNIPNGDIALFCGSMGVMMTIYQNDPSVINNHYLTVLTRIFGRN